MGFFDIFKKKKDDLSSELENYKSVSLHISEARKSLKVLISMQLYTIGTTANEYLIGKERKNV